MRQQEKSPAIRGAFALGRIDAFSVRRGLCAEVGELGARLRRFGGLRMTLDEKAQLANARVLLAQLQQGQSFAQLRGRGLGAAAEAFQHGIVGFHCFGVILLAVGDLAEVELGGAGQFVEVQATAEHTPFDDAQMSQLVDLARTGITELVIMQREIIGA